MNESLSLGYNIILYRTTSNDFAEKLVLKMKEKLCEERRFGVLNTLKTQELPGALPPGPPPGRCPLKRAPGPHAPLYLDTNYFYSEHPAVTNPAHAHGMYHKMTFSISNTLYAFQIKDVSSGV